MPRGDSAIPATSVWFGWALAALTAPTLRAPAGVPVPTVYSASRMVDAAGRAVQFDGTVVVYPRTRKLAACACGVGVLHTATPGTTVA